MPRYAYLFAAAALLTACSPSGPAETSSKTEGRTDGLADLTIEMSVEVIEGDILLVLFDSEEGYKSGDAIARAAKPAATTVTFTAEGLKPGQYAVKAFHDINGNGDLDTNLVGIPSEPYAFSNNAAGNFGPAKWADAAFDVTAPATVHKMEIK